MLFVKKLIKLSVPACSPALMDDMTLSWIFTHCPGWLCVCVAVPAQAPSAAQPGMGVASAVHLNSMQLMTVDRIAQINTQNMQPSAVAAQGGQNASIATQGLHTNTQITPQSIQTAPINPQQNPSEAKTSGQELGMKIRRDLFI